MLTVIFAVASLALGGIAYLVLNNVILSVVVSVSCILVTLFVLRPMIERYVENDRKRHECYRFVYSFIVSMSTTNSSESSFALAMEGSKGEEKDIVDAIAEFTIEEKLQYMATYYLEDYYQMFLSIYSIYQEQGGDILSLAEPLLIEVAEIEKNENAKNKIRINYGVQFLTLWAMSILILVSTRFGLSSFYKEISSSLSFVILGMVYFLILLGGSVYFASTITGLKPFLKGFKSNGKKKTN